MAKHPHHDLSRRERQIMDVLYARREATAAEVRAQLADQPSYSTVRALLRKLLDKGHVLFREEGPRYIYRPALEHREARKGAVGRLLRTFFDGNRVTAAVNLLGESERPLTAEEIARLETLVGALKAAAEDADPAGATDAEDAADDGR
ncbi:MAG: BlaI/MecI/CopY family transcriptional regulator [Pseudomonadota bacterium]